MHHIIYIPGLGDTNRFMLFVQKTALRTWRARDMRCEMMPMLWREPIPFEPRFEKLLARIDELHGVGHSVSLVGTSAGASSAVSAFYERSESVHRVVTICGKLKGTLPEAVEQINPSFAASMKLLGEALKAMNDSQRARILSIRALKDAVVPPEQSIVDGAKVRDIKLFGHNTTCVYTLFFHAGTIARFLRQK